MKDGKQEEAQKMIVNLKDHVKEVYDRLTKVKEALNYMQNKEFELGRLEISMNSI